MNGVKTVRFIEIKPGEWRAYGYPEMHFISMEEGIRRLRPSIAGFHGYRGWFQPYEPIAKYFGPGEPTPGHKWWKSYHPVAKPEIGTELTPGEQWIVKATYRIKGKVYERVASSKVGESYTTEVEADIYNRFEHTKEKLAGDVGVDISEIETIGVEWYIRRWDRVGM